ncbi:ferredoxin [Streptomyces sp. WI04-05B]|uniref:ferredoxin n=1 Tax=Streptomyces TaxID=1883 RepID=UPI0029B7167F|nr:MULTISPECIES: ferredoxin [unclassified Streptomyces]MDX2541582.1 ferredoxin [Streptomyces sp. WI04-05B]MDX2583684.1 ferredoxin [Streptomyces sp. WI04-05A]MDX3745469.1 ferredoxin [Streptomyces sp. AK08-02]
MKAAVDEDRCRGHGVCWTLCPEVFDLTDDGYAEVLVPEIPAEHEGAVRTAAGSCPERAIVLS